MAGIDDRGRNPLHSVFLYFVPAVVEVDDIEVDSWRKGADLLHEFLRGSTVLTFAARDVEPRIDLGVDGHVHVSSEAGVEPLLNRLPVLLLKNRHAPPPCYDILAATRDRRRLTLIVA